MTRRFRVIVADPPWSFGDKLTMSDTPRGAEANYPVLDVAALAALPVESLAAEDAVLVLWYPDSLATEALRVFSAWGFRQTQQWTWVKTGKHETRLDPADVADDTALAFGMGRLARNCCEHAFVGVRGRPYQHLASKNVRNIFLHPATPHSKKPETVQDALERMFPEGDRLELFARRERLGWLCVGNESPTTHGYDIRDILPHLIGE